MTDYQVLEEENEPKLLKSAFKKSSLLRSTNEKLPLQLRDELDSKIQKNNLKKTATKFFPQKSRNEGVSNPDSFSDSLKKSKTKQFYPQTPESSVIPPKNPFITNKTLKTSQINDKFFSETFLNQMQIYKILSINTIEYIRYLTELPEQLELSRISDYLEWYLTRTESSFLFNEISSQTDFYYRNIIIAPNASRFSTLGFDFSIQVYSYPERQLLLRINQNNLCIMSFSYNGGLLGLIIPRDGIVVYDIDNTDELVKYPGKFSCFTFSKGSSMLGCCYKEGFKVEIWCLKELIFTETRSEAKGIKILEFSNDDTLFVAGTLEGVLYLWDIRFGTLVSSLNLNLDILCLSFSGDNQIIGIGTSDRAVTLWAIHERNPISKLRGHRQNVNKLFFSKKNDILMSLDEKNYFMQWNINSRSIIKGLKKINEVSLSSAVLLDEELLTVGLDSSFMSWNLDNGYCKDEDQITFGEIDIEVKCGNETAFSYDGIYLAKVKNEDLILLSLWDTKTGTAIAESDVLPNDSGYIKNMVFSYDNRSLALCFQHELFIFNLKDFQDPIQGPLKTTENDQADTLSFTILKFSRNGLLASGTNNGLIIVWEGVQETSALKKKLLKEHEGYITALEFDPDKGNLLASGDGEGNIILWDVNKEETIGEMNRHEGPITCLLFFKNLTKMISAGEDFNMTMWNLNDYTVLHYFKGNLPGLIPLKLDLNLDESELIVGFNNGQLEIFRINHKVADTLYLIKYHHFPIMNLRYLENDHTILSQSSESSKVLRMKTEGSPIIYELDKPMALSFEGSKIISIVEDSTILVTKVNSEEIGLELIEHCTPIEFCTVSKRDGLLSGSQDGLMNYWDLNTGKLLVKNIKMTEKITASIAFDDKLILGGENGTIFLIDLLLNGQYNDNNQRNYVLNHSFKAHSKRITAIDNDYEGNIATAANDLKITIWHIVNNTVEKLIDIKEVIKAEIKELKFSLGGFYLYGTMKISNDIEELRKWEVHTGDSVLMKEKIKASRTFCINEDGRKVLTFMKVERNEWKLHLLNENLSKKSGIIVNLQEIGPREVPESISWSSNGDLFCFLKNRVVIYPDLFHDEEIFIKKLVRIGGFINDTNGMIVHMENNMLSMESIGRIYPFLYNLLHVMAYTDDYQGKFSDIVAALEKNRKILNINGFFERDIHDRIPFDILFMKKNRKLLQEFIEYFIKTYSTEEAYNAGFFKYLTIMKINELMMIFCEQTEFLSKVLDYIFAHPIDFPTRFYYRKLNKPFYILSKEPVLTIQKLKKTLIESKESDNSTVQIKARCLYIPALIDKNNKQTNDFFLWICCLSTTNPLFVNETLIKILDYKWTLYGQKEFLKEATIFLMFTAIYLFNNSYMLPLSIIEKDYMITFSNGPYQQIGVFLNFITYGFIMYYIREEVNQINIFGIKTYFSNLWNCFDTPLIVALLIVTNFSFLNLFDIGDSLPDTKILHSFAILFFFLRLLSYARGFQGTGFMIRLVMQCFNDIKYFIFLMFLFILGLTFAMYAQQSEFAMSLFEVFNAFFTEMLGDLGEYDELDEVSYTLQYIYFTITSIILTVAMLNMLISIISETFARVKDSEKMTMTYETVNIVTEMDVLQKKEEENEPKYLIYIYNEKHEEVEKSQIDELADIIKEHSKNMVNINEYVEDLKGSINKTLTKQRNKNLESFKKLSREMFPKKNFGINEIIN